MTRAALARQIVYYRRLRFDRRRIQYECKRLLGARWSRAVIAFIDDVIAQGGLPRSKTRDARRAELMSSLERTLQVKRRGRRWVRVERGERPALAKTARAWRRALERAGFRFAGVRGDVGQWADAYVYRRARGLEVYATVTLHERRRPYRLEQELTFG